MIFVNNRISRAKHVVNNDENTLSFSCQAYHAQGTIFNVSESRAATIFFVGVHYKKRQPCVETSDTRQNTRYLQRKRTGQDLQCAWTQWFSSGQWVMCFSYNSWDRLTHTKRLCRQQAHGEIGSSSSSSFQWHCRIETYRSSSWSRRDDKSRVTMARGTYFEDDSDFIAACKRTRALAAGNHLKAIGNIHSQLI